MDGRKEKRISRTLRVLLSSGGQPVVAEYASTENVSSSGARVRTDRPWRPDSRVVIKSSQGDLWARARVVYCQTVQSKTLQSRMFVLDRKSTRLNSSHSQISYAVFCLKKKNKHTTSEYQWS